MQTDFDYIIDFTGNEYKCIFCQRPMQAILTNFIGLKDEFRSKIINGQLIFKLQGIYRDTRIGDKFDCSLDMRTSKLSYSGNYDVHNVQDIFSDLSPHIEILCKHPYCRRKYNYYISSEVLPSRVEDNEIIISPFLLYMQSFTFKKFWIQNNWISKELCIYHREQIDVAPLRYKVISFENMSSEKIINKIKTLVSFS